MNIKTEIKVLDALLVIIFVATVVVMVVGASMLAEAWAKSKEAPPTPWVVIVTATVEDSR